MILNVTPEEYSEIAQARLDAELGLLNFDGYMRQHYECEYFTHYTIKVRRDVPSVPWYSRNIYRVEADDDQV